MTMTSIALEAMYSRERYGVLVAIVESLDEGISVHDGRGALLYKNGLLGRMLSAETDCDALQNAIDRARHQATVETGNAILSIARLTPGGNAAACEVGVRGSRAEYLVRARAVRAKALGELVIVTVRRHPLAPALSPAELAARYGLTRAETRVALLLEGARTSRQIAEQLGISVHTARRHAEAVLKKLGVHSRGAVAARLRDERHR
ncbi:MAG TPA: helix-turn-helix transcriptional regulator [Gemmatimonadaceae bacterium]|nr:helix-turn-helix transcriptional regulator [Gemmatimonadaceae bacterium]